MIYGHMVLNSRTTSEGQFACVACYENFTETGSNPDGCDDHFGGSSWWTECCPHCGSEEFIDGKIFLHKQGTRIAKKDHYDKNGKLIVTKGQKYKYRLIKGYEVNKKYKHIPYYRYSKWV